MSPDTSSLYSDRPIRPLPKRKIREKLPPELAGSIKYPPPAVNTVPLFIYPPQNSTGDERPETAVLYGEESEEASHAQRTTSSYGPKSNDDTALRNSHGVASFGGALNRDMHNQAFDSIGLPNQKPLLSATSSIDGYDSLENANNKKKRKIPSVSDMVHTSAHSLRGEDGGLRQPMALQSEPSNMKGETSHSVTVHPTLGSHTSNIQGICGPGRGRLGRPVNGRSPLRALPDGNNSWLGRSKSLLRQSTKEIGTTGIISSAIANAERAPASGQENVAGLPQHRSMSSKSTPSAAQFTFTCDSQVPGTIPWPGTSQQSGKSVESSRMASPAGGTRSRHTDENQRQPADSGPHNSRRKSRQWLERELSVAAQHRRQLAAERYYHSTPKPQDIWICEFCEYERIFGTPPRALIRNYEIKDRQHRQEEADRKRLLEKAKSKGRKAKKQGKNMKAPVETSPVTEQPVVEQLARETPETEQCHSTQSEYEYEDGYDDGESRIEANQAEHCVESNDQRSVRIVES